MDLTASVQREGSLLDTTQENVALALELHLSQGCEEQCVWNLRLPTKIDELSEADARCVPRLQIVLGIAEPGVIQQRHKGLPVDRSQYHLTTRDSDRHGPS